MENRDKRTRINEQTSRLTMDRTWHGQGSVPLPSQRNSGELFRAGDGTDIHLPRLIRFKENKFCLAIDYGFVPGQKIQPQNAIDAAVSGTRTIRITQHNKNAAKTHAAGCDILGKTHGQLLTIDLSGPDISQAALRRPDAERSGCRGIQDDLVRTGINEQTSRLPVD